MQLPLMKGRSAEWSLSALNAAGKKFPEKRHKIHYTHFKVTRSSYTAKSVREEKNIYERVFTAPEFTEETPDGTFSFFFPVHGSVALYMCVGVGFQHKRENS